MIQINTPRSWSCNASFFIFFITASENNVFASIMDSLTAAEKQAIIQKYLADPATTGGRDRLWRHIRQDHPSITRREVAAALAEDAVHQIHAPLKRRVTTRPIIISDRAKQAQIDLIDMAGLTGYNDSRRYILTYVDLLSKYCAARAITKKTAVNVNTALAEILDAMPKGWRPKTIQADNGKEFATLMEKSLDQRGIKLIHSQAYNPRTQGAIERFNRTLKSALFALMTRDKASRWLDYLQPLIDNFNNSVHESTGYKPIDLMRRPQLQKEVITEIHDRMERRRPKQAEAIHHEFEVGDFVRVALTTESAIRKQTFRKKIKNNWSAEVFQIYSVSNPEAAGAQPQYLLKNLFTNRKSLKKYWSYQLQEISEDAASQALAEHQERKDDHVPGPHNMQPDERAEAVGENDHFPEEARHFPAPARRSARQYAPSQQALQNLAQAP